MNFYLFLSMAAFSWTQIEGCEHYGDELCLEIKPIEGRHFINQFIVEIHGGEDAARMVARETGFEFMEPASDRENHYFFTHTEIPRRHKMQHDESVSILRSHDKVLSAAQQYVWRPTLNQLENYKDFVGYEKPIVVVSTFDPQERIAYYQEIMNRSLQPSYEEEWNRKESSNEEDRAAGINVPVPKLPPLDEVLDIKGLQSSKVLADKSVDPNLAPKKLIIEGLRIKACCLNAD